MTSAQEPRQAAVVQIRHATRKLRYIADDRKRPAREMSNGHSPKDGLRIHTGTDVFAASNTFANALDSFRPSLMYPRCHLRTNMVRTNKALTTRVPDGFNKWKTSCIRLAANSDAFHSSREAYAVPLTVPAATHNVFTICSPPWAIADQYESKTD